MARASYKQSISVFVIWLAAATNVILLSESCRIDWRPPGWPEIIENNAPDVVLDLLHFAILSGGMSLFCASRVA